VPRAGDAGRAPLNDDPALVEGTPEVRAPVGQHADLGSLPEDQQRQVAELAPDRPPVRQFGQRAQVVPAQPGQMADLLGVAGARAEPERQVTAQVGADGGDGEAGRGQRPAEGLPPAGPGGQRPEEQGGRARLAHRVHEADPLLVAVQGRPVGQAGGRRRRGARYARRDQHAGRAFGAAERVEQHR